MKLFIVEDHALMREAIWRVCDGESGWDVVGEVDTGAAAIELIPHVRPDAIVLDLMLQDVSGFVVADRVRAFLPTVRILVLSHWLKEYVVLRLDEIGVQGYVTKGDCNTAILRSALTALASGGTYFSKNFQAFKRERCNDPLGAGKLLSRRERRVLALVGVCKSDEEIADILNLTPSTAQWHRSNLLLKLNIRGTPRLIAYSQQTGFALAAGDMVAEMAHEAIANGTARPEGA